MPATTRSRTTATPCPSRGHQMKRVSCVVKQAGRVQRIALLQTRNASLALDNNHNKHCFCRAR
ncbi:hypothetical protein RTBOTA2_003527 [Rhodotorula toruloides]|nr:hypothetical protein RTBOTA2_003527 [Rhodotorula toruloides]